jgi:competence protein ComFC
MNGMARRAQNILLDAIFPPRCAGCGDFESALFCDSCRATLQPITAPYCARCGTPFDPLSHPAAECADCRGNRYHGAPPFAAVRSCYAFTGALRPAVHRFKYRGKTALAPQLGELLFARLVSDAALPRDEIKLLCPVPLHSWRRWRRGYNQSELLAGELGRLCGIRHAEILRRTRRTTPQVGLHETERLANVQGAFAVDEKGLEQFNPTRGPVLLIDDVCTTGATLAECARALKKAGIKEVYGLTLARQL